jgi:hypothetical protein
LDSNGTVLQLELRNSTENTVTYNDDTYETYDNPFSSELLSANEEYDPGFGEPKVHVNESRDIGVFETEMKWESSPKDFEVEMFI